MNVQKNLYIIFYATNPVQQQNAKVLKIITSPEETIKYLMTKTVINGQKVNKDERWIIKVYEHVGSNERYEYSKWETGQFKSNIGICLHCHEYFIRTNNSNMCDFCLGQLKQGLKECEVCLKFFNPVGDKFISNGDVFPSLACGECSEEIIKNLKIK